MSLFSTRNKEKASQPWTFKWTPGADLANLYSLYESKGDVTRTDYAVPTVLDGPIQVERYGHLTANGAITASQRCRGLMILADRLTMGASGSISMTGMGARGSRSWAFDKNIFVPASITVTGDRKSTV